MIDHHRDILQIERGTYCMCKVSGVKVAPRAHQKIKIRNLKFEIPSSCLCYDVIGNLFTMELLENV